MRLILSPELEQVIGEQSRRLGMSPEHIVLSILRQQLIPETRGAFEPAGQENRMAVLAKIRNRRYACPASDNLLPSDSFAARKEDEKKREEMPRA